MIASGSTALKWWWLTVCTVLVAGLAACVAIDDRRAGVETGDRVARAATPWPSAPPVRVCGNDSILGNGPSSPPDGAITVPAGDNRSFEFTRAGRTFWFAPGVHTLGPGEYSQIVPARNSRYVGAPGAVLDGRRLNRYAFTGYAPGVTIEYLTIQNFGPVGGNNDEGVVNHNAADDWTVKFNTIRWNAGAGLMPGSGNVVEYNCLTRNGQYGFDAYSPAGPVNLVLDHNEVSFNNTYNWEAKVAGCGCSGGGKFWSVKNATVTNNYVHHNKSVGLWADNNNSGFLIQGNYISDNDDVGILYETSYNAVIRDNLIVRNALVAGPRNPGFPTAGIYVSESGADSRVPGRFRTALEINDNLLKDNWAGVALWENADRYCGSPANTSTGECTLVNPRVANIRTCRPRNIAREPYIDDCRWKTRQVKVHDNVFESSPQVVGPECTFRRSCGVNALFSNFGTYPDWSPYKGVKVQEDITFRQGNVFYDNTYRGAWRFLVLRQGDLVDFDAWRRDFDQDAGSTAE